MKHKLVKIILFTTILLNISCTTYETTLKNDKISNVNLLKKGNACSHNLFGGFTIPYLGDTAINITGNESVVNAIAKANVKEVFVVDKLKKNYIFYSKRCSIIYGR